MTANHIINYRGRKMRPGKLVFTSKERGICVFLGYCECDGGHPVKVIVPLEEMQRLSERWGRKSKSLRSRFLKRFFSNHLI